MANHDEFRQLLDLYIAKGLDAAQKERMALLLQDPANEGMLEEDMRESFFEQGILTEASDETVDRVMHALEPVLSTPPLTKRIFPARRWLAAASVLLVLAGTAWLLVINRHAERPNKPIAGNSPYDILPARKGAAILRLANGQQIHIDSAAPGLIARQGNIEIIKGSDGTLSYRGTNTGAVLYNEIETIKGQELTVTLPDGSVVTLNTASSIRYPLTFDNGERSVTMNGEAHFKVVHDAARPFRIRVKEQVIEDLGTAFNINAYEDEPVVTTTLVEGSVSIKNGSKKAVLRPGEEAVTTAGKEEIKVSKADLDMNLAWYKGEFSFKHANITTIMREFARWYNVDISYGNGFVPDATFTGGMGRDLTLTQALDGLKIIGIHYRIDDNRRLTILP